MLLSPLSEGWFDIRRLVDYRNDPVGFVRDVLGETPQKWQEEAMIGLVKTGKLAIRSGHGVGKTKLMCWILYWFAFTRTDVKVRATAPTASQLKDILWSEVRKTKEKLPQPLRQMVTILDKEVRIYQSLNQITARTASKSKPEALQGLHDGNVLLLIDEAAGIEEPIFEAAAGSLTTKGAMVVMAANPTKLQGKFFRVFNSEAKGWHLVHVNAEECEYVNREELLDWEEKYGRDSNFYRIRALGEFPTEDIDAVIPYYLLNESVGRDIMQDGEIVWGVDVAELGNDRAALSRRHGNKTLVKTKWWQGLELQELAGRIAVEYWDTHQDLRPSAVQVDAIGVGSGLVPLLREKGVPAFKVNVAENPSTVETHHRLKDELWFKARAWLMSREVSMIDDPELFGELSTMSYYTNDRGKIVVDKNKWKDDHGGKSPDLADSFVLTFARWHPNKAPKKRKPLQHREDGLGWME